MAPSGSPTGRRTALVPLGLSAIAPAVLCVGLLAGTYVTLAWFIAGLLFILLVAVSARFQEAFEQATGIKKERSTAHFTIFSRAYIRFYAEESGTPWTLWAGLVWTLCSIPVAFVIYLWVGPLVGLL